MKIGIIGLPQVGKKTLFELLTGDKISEQSFGISQEVKMGAAKVRDSRFDKLVDMYRPKSSVPATIDIVLLPRFDKETVQSGEFLKSVEKCDALCHLVRVFQDDSVFHVDGSVDPLRDIENVTSELIISDLILAEKRLERIELERKKGGANPLKTKEKEIMLRMKDILDQDRPLVNFKMTDDERKLMSTYQFVTRKPLLIVLNVNDDKLIDSSLVDQIKEKYQDFDFQVMQTSAKIEAELFSLPEEEQAAFLEDLGLSESTLNRLSTLYFEALGLISFFTVGEDEVRQWTTRKGVSAPEAAGSIHSDLQRGFIRAEIMKVDELLAAGSEGKLKEEGKMMLKGKDYIVEDGDIMHVRFNV